MYVSAPLRCVFDSEAIWIQQQQLIKILLASYLHEADSVNSQVSPCNAESTKSQAEFVECCNPFT